MQVLFTTSSGDLIKASDSVDWEDPVLGGDGNGNRTGTGRGTEMDSGEALVRPGERITYLYRCISLFFA